MTWKGVIFDCDGTLVDSERVANEVLVDYLRELGVLLSLQESASRFNGVEMKDSMQQLEEIMGSRLPHDFEDSLRTRLDRALADRLRPVDGVHRLVAALTVPYCVASNAPVAKINLSLSVTGLLPLFDGVIHSAYHVGMWKPNPALFLHAAQTLRLATADCAVVEDSIAGIRGGLAAGMTVFAYQPHEVDARIPKAVRVFAHFDELHDVFQHAGLIA